MSSFLTCFLEARKGAQEFVFFRFGTEAPKSQASRTLLQAVPACYG